MICFRNYHFIALAVLLFSVASWADCITIGYQLTNTANACTRPAGIPGCNPSSCDNYVGQDCEIKSGGTQYKFGHFTQVERGYCQYGYTYCDMQAIVCKNDCEADSVKNGGIILECQYDIVSGKYYKWTCQGGNSCSDGYCRQDFYDDESLCEEKYCEDNPSACIDSTVCDEARQRCRKLGGVFSGEPLQDGCSSSCNTCGTNATKQILKLKSQSCCSQGLAPEVDAMCRTDIQSGVGETYSTNANTKCADPNLSEEAAGWYAEYCSGDYDWDEEGSSSSGGEGESSSSGEGEYSSGEGFSSAEGLEGDYYPILDTIRDTLIDIRRNVENIYLCLITPSACAGLSTGQDTVIVNVPSDSVKLKDISSKLTVLDTSIHNSNDRLLEGISHANDTLIDSMRKYLQSLQSVGFSGDTLGDSISAVNRSIKDLPGDIAHSLDSSILSGYGSADTGSGNFPWISQGEGQRDSILGGGPGGTGFSGLDFGADSAWMDSMENVGYVCDGDSCCIGDKCEYFESDSMIVDSLQRHAQRLADSVAALNEAFYEDSVDNIFQQVKDSLIAYNPLQIFDSTLMTTLGASIPNTNTCPDDCSTFQVDIPFLFGTQHATIDWGLCMGRAVFAGGNVLSFLRFIIRIIVAVTCITAVMWNATRIRR